MRNIFFEKPTNLNVPQGNYFKAFHKMDAHTYALERVEEAPSDYVAQAYSQCTHTNFVRYMANWQEIESVKVQPPPDKKSSLSSKKKGMNLQAFLSRKKIDTSEMKGIALEKEEEPKEEYRNVEIIYIQMEEFFPFEFPREVTKIKNVMAITYELAIAVYQKDKLWPHMLPVASKNGMIRFLKKGKCRNEELSRLFHFMMKGIEAEEWSSEMVSIYEMSEINGDNNLLGEKLHLDLIEISRRQYPVVSMVQEKCKEQNVSIIGPETLGLLSSQIKLPLNEFIITFPYQDNQKAEVLLQHKYLDDIVLEFDSQNLIFQYLQNFRAPA